MATRCCLYGLSRCSVRYISILASLTFNRKDKTLALILETICSIDEKIDLVLSRDPLGSTSGPTGLTADRNLLQRELENDDASFLTEAQETSGSLSHIAQHKKASPESGAQTYLMSPEFREHELSNQSIPSRGPSLAWPAIQALLQCESINLSQWDGETRSVEKWLVDITQDFHISLPLSGHRDIHYDDNAALNLEPGQPMTLNRGYVETICSIYFETFHCTYPILDRSHFFSAILPQVCSQSFDETNPGSALVLLVLSLGVLAQEGATGVPIPDEAGWQTGVRGGYVERPPGIDFLNAAKSRLSMALTEWSLDSLSAYILCA